jgi:hypothetical protein
LERSARRKLAISSSFNMDDSDPNPSPPRRRGQRRRRTTRVHFEPVHPFPENQQVGDFAVRYLDDLITDNSLIQGFQNAYDHYGLKLVLTGSTLTEPMVTFLDLDLALNLQHKRVLSDLHIKELKANTYLHWSSANPRQHYRNIIHGFIFRLVRNCNLPDRFGAHLERFRQDLLQRGYPQKFIDDTMFVSLYRARQDVDFERRNGFTKAWFRKNMEDTAHQVISFSPHTCLPRSARPSDVSQECPQFARWLLPSTTIEIPRYTLEHMDRPLAPLVPLSAFSRQQLALHSIAATTSTMAS